MKDNRGVWWRLGIPDAVTCLLVYFIFKGRIHLLV